MVSARYPRSVGWMLTKDVHSQVRVHRNARSAGEPAAWLIAVKASATEPWKVAASWVTTALAAAMSWSLPGRVSASGL